MSNDCEMDTAPPDDNDSETLEDLLDVLLECEGGDRLGPQAVCTALKLLRRVPSLREICLRVLTSCSLLEFEKQNSDFTSTEVIVESIVKLLDHHASSWAPVLFQWSVELLGNASRIKQKSDFTIEASLKHWLGIQVVRSICNMMVEAMDTLIKLPSLVEQMVHCVLDSVRDESEHIRWLLFFVISQYPAVLVPCIIRQAASGHKCSENALCVNLADCFTHLACFHGNVVEENLASFTVELFHLEKKADIVKKFDFLFCLLKRDHSLFCLYAKKCLHKISLAKVHAVLATYHGVQEPKETKSVVVSSNQSPVVVMETEPISEDEGEVISDDEDNSASTGALSSTVQSKTSAALETNKTRAEQQLTETGELADYTPMLVELLCRLTGDVATTAICMLLECTGSAEPTSKDKLVEEGEVGEAAFLPATEPWISEAARMMNLLIVKLQQATFTPIYPVAKGTGPASEHVLQFASSLCSNGQLLCDMLLGAADKGVMEYWLFRLVTIIAQLSSEFEAAKLITSLLLKCSNRNKLSLVANCIHEVIIVHSDIVMATMETALSQCKGHSSKLFTGNVLYFVQLTKATAKQLLIKQKFLDAVREVVLPLSQLLVTEDGDDYCTSTTIALLSLLETVACDVSQTASLSDKIVVAKNLLACFFHLIKIDCHSNGNSSWLVRCLATLSSIMLQRPDDGLSNFIFSSLLTTVLSEDLGCHFGRTVRIPRANTIHPRLKPSTVPRVTVTHNADHVLHLLYTCCHADETFFKKIAMAMMDQVAPIVPPGYVPWPTREHFKYYVETDHRISKTFDENPILWNILLLVAEDVAAILWCAGIMCSLLCVLVNYWHNSKMAAVTESPVELRITCRAMEVLRKAKWLHVYMERVDELFNLLSPPEMFQLLHSIYIHIKCQLSHDRHELNTEENLTSFTETLKTILQKHVVHLGSRFSRYYPKEKSSFIKLNSPAKTTTDNDNTAIPEATTT